MQQLEIAASKLSEAAERWNTLRVISDNHDAEPDYPTQPMPALSLKKGDVIERAIQMLKDNPYWQKRTLRDLENETGIDRNTWAKAKRRSK